MLQLPDPLFEGAPVRAEDRLIFAGKSVPEPVLQDAAGPDDIRVLPVILDHPDQLLPHRLGKSPFHQFVREFLCQREIAFRRPLPDPEIPEIVVDDIRIVHV